MTRRIRPTLRRTLGLVVGGLGLCSAPWLSAEPRVAGFNRFYAAAPDAEGGRLLYNELGCAGCHGGDTGLPARRGPDLAGVTTRARPEWLEAFLTEPEKVHPGTVMPQWPAGRGAAAAGDIVHYLGTLKPKAPVRPKLIRHMDGAHGRDLFHSRGCVACHEPRGDFVPAEGPTAGAETAASSVPLPDLKAKYVLVTLSEFIRDPLKPRPDGRMPKVPLEEQDAVDIACYLLGLSGSDGEESPKLATWAPDRIRAERGRVAVQSLNCVACHDLPGQTRTQTPIVIVDNGCLAEAPPPAAPRYNLGAAQRQALVAHLGKSKLSLTIQQRATLTLRALNCTACHERDGRGGPEVARLPYFTGDHNLGDTGRFPPPLTGVGGKLTLSWLEQSLKGSVTVRPYLQTRMPYYGEGVGKLAALLAESDVHQEAKLPLGDVEAGRKLLGTQGGVNCITCHRWGDRASLGIQGLDLANLTQRLRPGWLRAYLINPAGYRPGTLMPSFWPEGKASNTAVLGGDTDPQIASILAFAGEGKGLPEGFPSLTTKEFELVPRDRPIVLRTFFAGVGTHAIVVGFPAGFHLAYDGQAGRPVLAWKGRFFDAYGTWFSRFAPFEKPLGESVVSWPAPTAPASTIRCDGYRLDEAGVPTFLLSFDGVPVEDRFEATPQGLRRTLRWKAEALRLPPPPHPPGVTVTAEPTGAAGKLSYLYTW